MTSEYNKPSSWLCRHETTEDVCERGNVMQVVNHYDGWQMTRLRRRLTVNITHNLRNILLYVTNVLGTRHKCHDISIFRIFTMTSETNKQVYKQASIWSDMSVSR